MKKRNKNNKKSKNKSQSKSQCEEENNPFNSIPTEINALILNWCGKYVGIISQTCSLWNNLSFDDKKQKRKQFVISLNCVIENETLFNWAHQNGCPFNSVIVGICEMKHYKKQFKITQKQFPKWKQTICEESALNGQLDILKWAKHKKCKAEGLGSCEPGKTHCHCSRLWIACGGRDQSIPGDTEAELDILRTFCETRGANFALSEAYAKGGEGAAALAQKVVEVIEANPDVELTTADEFGDPVIEKITKVAQKVYGADAIELSERAKENLARFTRWGFGKLPICIAKTQYSLSDDPKRLGAPTGWTLHVTDIALSAGAGFLVVISGAMMLMPGLPKVSRALGIDVDERGEITGMS